MSMSIAPSNNNAVMAGLVPAIHVLFLSARKEGVDARDKPGHDDELKVCTS